jgi:NADH-ubiquinone oxidoreductase chain 5
VAQRIHESIYLITIPLSILALGSIFVGYCTKDIFVGVGSPFLNHSVLILPDRNSLYLAEFLPFTIKNLPLFFGIFSLCLVWVIYELLLEVALNYHPLFKDIHFFLSYKWYFDVIYNRYINYPLLHFGYRLPYKAIDKGLIEIVGPRGIFTSLN